MKIGDKVRFLSEVGGGKISGFQGNNIVLVEDEDGFEIPTPINDVVVVGNDDMAKAKITKLEQAKDEKEEGNAKSIKAQLSDNTPIDTNKTGIDDEEEDYDPADKFVPQPRERDGGNTLTAYLAFVPTKPREMNNTDFETYIVNDSNYYIHYLYMVGTKNQWQCKAVGELEPNTKLFVEQFSYSDLNTIAEASIQIFAYKPNKTFERKPALNAHIRIDGTKFYKLNTFRENDFFDTPALLYTVTEKEKAPETIIDTKIELPKKLQSSNTQAVEPTPQPARKPLERRYENSQSKAKYAKQILKNDKIVVDLHAEEVLETTAGLTPGDILEYQMGIFRSTLEQYKNKNQQKIVFIHGKGEGVLRRSIIRELNYKYKKYHFQDASFREYGYGATQVTIIT
jgi:hypothetical protein